MQTADAACHDRNADLTMIRLVHLDDRKLDGLLYDLDAHLDALVSNGLEVREFLRPVLQQTRDFHLRVASVPPWQSYFGVLRETNVLAGVCAFKGGPNAAGEVEIAYGTAPGLEGRGYATAMAVALREIAFESAAVRRVIAHTLPEPNASTRVLQKAGLTFAGEVMDPEDGRVWRWEIAKSAA